jgi:hypothetical protein
MPPPAASCAGKEAIAGPAYANPDFQVLEAAPLLSPDRRRACRQRRAQPYAPLALHQTDGFFSRLAKGLTKRRRKKSAGALVVHLPRVFAIHEGQFILKAAERAAR